MDFQPCSVTLTKTISIEEKKKNGIYFTPPSIVNKILFFLQNYLSSPPKRILEPSCGSGEFLVALTNVFPKASITAIEKNDTIFNNVSSLSSIQGVTYLHQDFLKHQCKPSKLHYDLIIGNPPYFVIPKSTVSSTFLPFIEGRPNIFLLFILHSLSLLQENGILAFVLPSSFLTCSYYNGVRKQIASTCTILQIIECKEDKYLETQQNTIAWIVQKKENKMDSPYIWKIQDNYVIFNTEERIQRIRSLTRNTTTLAEMGMDVYVGPIVWNQVKTELCNDPTQTRLVYSSDIRNRQFVPQYYKNDTKQNFIRREGIHEPMVVINRGYGIGNYKLEYCLLDMSDTPFLVENHLICIVDSSKERDEKIKRLNIVIQSLEHKDTQEFISLYFENGAINVTELKTILPIQIE
jgi:adenine-specific DNA-methyltransferase